MSLYLSRKSTAKYIFVSLLLSQCYCMRVLAEESLRDPTRPLTFSTDEKKKIQLNLQAIFERNNGNEAVVNGQRVKQGEYVVGVKILTITRDSVVYAEDGRNYTLKLRDSIF